VSSNPSIARGRGVPASGREVFRMTTPLVVWWVWVAFAVANLADLGVEGSSVHFVLRIAAILAVITGLVYALGLRPRVIAGPAGVEIVNPFRVHHVPWAVIQQVDTGDWVRVHHTRDGAPVTDAEAPGKAIECWALYIPARMKRREARGIPRTQPGVYRKASSMLGQRHDVPESSRMPAEAQYIASLPPARAIAATLESRAAKARARGTAEPGPVTAAWSWLPITAVLAPAVALLIVLLA
jgi:hypothetical protein